jgi:hypothetical protein
MFSLIAQILCALATYDRTRRPRAERFFPAPFPQWTSA